MTTKMLAKTNITTFTSVLLAVSLLWAQCAHCSPLPRDDNLLSAFLLDVAPIFLGQRSANINGTDAQYKPYLEANDLNREVASSTTQEIIVRSGFKYENHYVLADDGYITQLVRIINPLADRNRLKQPPVMLLHGGLTDPTTHVWASSIQHHPELYPRPPGAPPISSSNRSLGFTLANNGYDVWLIGTRGANHQNQGHLRFRLFSPPGLTGEPRLRNRPETDPLFELADSLSYWDFSMDEIRKYELPRQVDRVLELTGAQNVSLMSFSLSTMIVLPLFGENRTFSRKVHNHILMAPIVSNEGTNKFVKTLHEITSKVDYKLGVLLVNGLTLTQPVRDLILRVTLTKETTYSVYKFFALIIAGSSSRYHTFLESPVLGHVMEETGFRELQHYSQQVIASQLQPFDYGPQRNQQLYSSLKPPAFNISQLHVKNWMLISAENDNLATPASVRQLLKTVRPKPLQQVVVPGGSHYDLLAAFKVDQLVTLPILNFLDNLRLPTPADIASGRAFEPSFEALQTNLQLVRYVPAISEP